MNRKIRIGITLSIDPTESLFTNGIRQNVVILRELYELCENVETAYIINTSGKSVPDDISAPLYPYRRHIITLKEVEQKCDLIVVAHGSLFKDEYKYFSNKGIKIAKLILGPSVSIFNETILFKDNKQAQGLFGTNLDTVSEIWLSEHYFKDRYFFETIYGCKSFIAPYVWDPRFLEKLKPTLYKPSGKKEKRVSNFEPNLNMVKNSTYPIVIIEKFFRQYPELLGDVYFFNTSIIKTKTDLIDFVKDLNSYKSGKISFEGGINIIKGLNSYSDIMLSHQNQNELNYIYLDAAWLGYPVLHNSPMMKEIGFYYPNNDAEIASQQLKRIATDFDDYYQEYLINSRQSIKKYMITNQEHIENYSKMIERVMDR